MSKHLTHNRNCILDDLFTNDLFKFVNSKTNNVYKVIDRNETNIYYVNALEPNYDWPYEAHKSKEVTFLSFI